jgi:hypothetical protein
MFTGVQFVFTGFHCCNLYGTAIRGVELLEPEFSSLSVQRLGPLKLATLPQQVSSRRRHAPRPLPLQHSAGVSRLGDSCPMRHLAAFEFKRACHSQDN